jgi:hypothetical protein
VITFAAETGEALKSWSTFYGLMIAFVVIVAGLVVFGHSGNTQSRTARFLLRIPDGLERVVRIPGWAAAMVSVALFGLLMAGQGFYNDVAWHVGLGRDKELFTAPHTGIVVGLGLILLSGLFGVLFASLQGVDTPIRWKAVRIPWSSLPLLALGGAAVCGFPLDELWHREFGVDVTMWSPTHMLMILGAAFVGVAAWLVLADAGVKPHDSRWSMGIHVVAAWLTLQGLIAPLGEFSFGVPQFQQIFHPMILVIASAFAFVAMRLVLGPWWGIGIAAFNIVSTTNLLGGEDVLIETKVVGIYVASAIAVEIAARLVGVEQRMRFAVVAGVGVATLGFAGDYWWNSNNAYQPWNGNLLPDAIVFGVIVGIAAALLAAAFARAAGHQPEAERIPRAVLAVAGLTLLVCLALPMPRATGDVTATIRIIDRAGGFANVDVRLDPANAADEARFFQAGAWAGGGLDLANMERVGAGHYVSEHRIPISGAWKSLLRLHRGGEMMAIALHLPSDPELNKPELVAQEKTMAFQPEPRYLLREQHAGNNLFKNGVYTLLAGVVVLWIAAFSVAIGKIAPIHSPRRKPPVKLARDGEQLPLHAARPA